MPDVEKVFGFRVMSRQCETCIYRPNSPLDINKLEAEVADNYGGFEKHRQCHHSSQKNPACCRGFWEKTQRPLSRRAISPAPRYGGFCSTKEGGRKMTAGKLIKILQTFHPEIEVLIEKEQGTPETIEKVNCVPMECLRYGNLVIK